MEFKLNGPIQHAGGIKDQTDKTRGPYLIEGLSVQKLHDKKKVLWDAAESLQGQISDGMLKKQLEQLAATSKCNSLSVRSNLTAFFQLK